MACNITDGIGRPACPGETPNCYDTFWGFNRDKADFVLGSGRTIEDITFDPGQGFFQIVAAKGTVRAYEERTDDDSSATDYSHAVDFKIEDLSIDANDWVNSLNGVSLGVVVRTKGGKFIVLGYNDGVTMKVNTMDTNADALGEFITLRENNVDEKTRRMLDTDEATTLALILSKVVGS